MNRGDSASVCITSYNNARTLKGTLESIMGQPGPSLEIVVADNRSNDGSGDYLSRLEEQGKIKLVERRCTRGMGRQIAFEHSTGGYVFASVDADTVYKPIFAKILYAYKRRFEGKLLVMNGLQLSSREVAGDLGWRDLQSGEDREMWARAAKGGRLVYVDHETRLTVRKMGGGRVSPLHKLTYHYEVARDAWRTSFSIPRIASETRSVPSMMALAILMIPSGAAAMALPTWKDKWNGSFRLIDYRARNPWT